MNFKKIKGKEEKCRYTSTNAGNVEIRLIILLGGFQSMPRTVRNAAHQTPKNNFQHSIQKMVAQIPYHALLELVRQVHAHCSINYPV